VICNAYDVVVVPFPFTDRRVSKRRPAMVLSSSEFNAASGNTVLAMITSAANPPSPLDIEIDSKKAGLKAPSKVRMKLFTLDNRLILNKAGALAKNDRVAIDLSLMRLLGKR
jgi:mRNA interferase MazF